MFSLVYIFDLLTYIFLQRAVFSASDLPPAAPAAVSSFTPSTNTGTVSPVPFTVGPAAPVRATIVSTPTVPAGQIVQPTVIATTVSDLLAAVLPLDFGSEQATAWRTDKLFKKRVLVALKVG